MNTVFILMLIAAMATIIGVAIVTIDSRAGGYYSRRFFNILPRSLRKDIRYMLSGIIWGTWIIAFYYLFWVIMGWIIQNYFGA